MMSTREHHSQKIPTVREVIAVQIITKYLKHKVCKFKTCLIILPCLNIVNLIHPLQQIDKLRPIKINNKLKYYWRLMNQVKINLTVWKRNIIKQN